MFGVLYACVCLWLGMDTHSGVGNEQISDSVTLTFLLSLHLNGHITTHHHTISGPVLSTLFLQRETEASEIRKYGDHTRAQLTKKKRPVNSNN